VPFFDGFPAEDQKEEKVKKQQATPYCQCDVKLQQELAFRGDSPYKPGAQVPTESCIEEKILLPVATACHPCSDKDDGVVEDRYDDHPGIFFSIQCRDAKSSRFRVIIFMVFFIR